MPAHSHRPCLGKQRGAALMLMLVIVVMGALTFLVSSLSTSALKSARQEITAQALAQAKEALIGYSVSQALITDTGYLPLPDIGWAATPEGSSEGTYGSMDFSLIGKLPWKTLGIAPVKDGNGECLWYVLSGRFKNSTSTLTPIFNWDTLGQIDVIDANGNPLFNNIAALIVAPDAVLDSQNRSLANTALKQCGGNYDTRNYLDSYNSADAIAGEVNYFVNYASYTNNMLAPNTNNKRFVQTRNDHYNDQFLFITVEDIFRPIIRRTDFRDQISALLDDIDFKTHLQTVSITGTKGTGNVDCNAISNADNKTFCKNWKEMLLLTALPSPPQPVTIDGATSAPCTRVLIFGGQKTAAQVRLTTSDKSSPANYLEGANLSAFATPVASSSSFSGASTFSADNPHADLLKCLP